MSKTIKTSELFNVQTSYLKELFCTCEYCYEIVKNVEEYVKKVAPTLQGFTKLKEGVYVGNNVKIHENAVIEGFAIIGSGCQIRVGAYLRGNVIMGENCIVGNSTELKNCVLLNGVQVPHYNYVGDSVLGNFTHLGAGTICSNLKLDGSNIVLKVDKEHPTNMRKLGAILGDYANVGAGVIINPGTILGKNTLVYSGVTLRGVYEDNVIVKANGIATKKEW